jgi:ABC-type protease/lipase transport system fused ATPase/permease subunit
LARALYGQPRIVVLDEPNANLDAEGEQALLQALIELKAQGSTVILITHKPGLVSSMDYLLVMRDGRIELLGPREEVLARLNGNKAPPNSATSVPGNISPNPGTSVIRTGSNA